MAMEVGPVTLQGRSLRLEPLAAFHAADLLRVAGDRRTFDYMFSAPPSWNEEGFRTYIRGLAAMENQVALAMVREDTGEAIGVSTYLDIRPSHRGLEIGSTWIGPPYQGTFVNPEAKFLMLRHAFDDLGAVRVQLKTDGRNLHSQAAIRKLGAVYEGTLRKHIILPDGFIRDTVMFSITAEEWPAVREGLIHRLGYRPA
ncbi:MAG TPA: GNAT family protein [Chloroflexota bacterium]|nr:GNAT family protein [Chloroflexota bacterium]